MICPSTTVTCDNPGCRRGGCQGRLPELPLFHAPRLAERQTQPADPDVTTLRIRVEQPERLAA